MDGAMISSKGVRELLQAIRQQYEKKNLAYGNSAHESYVEYGEISYQIRIGDKLRRWATLTGNPDIGFGDERIADTLKDAICYCFMAVGSMIGGVVLCFSLISASGYVSHCTSELLQMASDNADKIANMTYGYRDLECTYDNMKEKLKMSDYGNLVCMLLYLYFRECGE